MARARGGALRLGPQQHGPKGLPFGEPWFRGCPGAASTQSRRPPQLFTRVWAELRETTPDTDWLTGPDTQMWWNALKICKLSLMQIVCTNKCKTFYLLKECRPVWKVGKVEHKLTFWLFCLENGNFAPLKLRLDVGCTISKGGWVLIFIKRYLTSMNKHLCLSFNRNDIP